MLSDKFVLYFSFFLWGNAAAFWGKLQTMLDKYSFMSLF